MNEDTDEEKEVNEKEEAKSKTKTTGSMNIIMKMRRKSNCAYRSLFSQSARFLSILKGTIYTNCPKECLNIEWEY
jgi:hypothetical protein